MFFDSIVDAHYRIGEGYAWTEIQNTVNVAWNPSRNILVDPTSRRNAIGEALLGGQISFYDPEQLTRLAGIGEYGGGWFEADTLYPRFRFRWTDWDRYTWKTTFWPVVFCAVPWRGGSPPAEAAGGGQGVLTKAMAEPNIQRCQFIVLMRYCEVPADPGRALFKNHILHERED